MSVRDDLTALIYGHEFESADRILARYVVIPIADLPKVRRPGTDAAQAGKGTAYVASGDPAIAWERARGYAAIAIFLETFDERKVKRMAEALREADDDGTAGRITDADYLRVARKLVARGAEPPNEGS